MTSRFVSRFVVAVVAFVIPVAIVAMPVRQADVTPKETTLSVDPNEDGLVRLSRPYDGGTLAVEGRNVRAVYSPTGLTVRMADGSMVSTVGGQKTLQPFRTLELKFAPNGDMISMRADY